MDISVLERGDLVAVSGIEDIRVVEKFNEDTGSLTIASEFGEQYNYELRAEEITAAYKKI